MDTIRRCFFIFLPIIVLVGDYFRFPAIVENRLLTENVNINSILANQVGRIGTFKAHQVFVAIDSIYNERYLSYIKGSPNALVISLYVYEYPERPTVGFLGRAVLEKLMQVSPNDGSRLRDLFDQIRGRSPGEILELALDIPEDRYYRFPIKHLFVLLIKEGNSGQSKDVISKGITGILEKAKRKNVSALIIPCLGYNWEDKNSISFDGCLGPVFRSLPIASAPRQIYLSLYTDWPTFALEQAVASLNGIWKENFQASYGRIPIPYRGDLRLILFLLSVCLLVCSFYAPLTVKNFLIIVSSFVGSAVGSGSLIAFVTQGYDAAVHLFVRAIVLIVLAVGLPFFVHWNPQDIFGKGRR